MHMIDCFKSMYKVVHLIPYDGVGGVEAAANSMGNQRREEIDFKLEYIYPNYSDDASYKIYNPLYLMTSAMNIIRECPDLLIVSLWRSYIVGIIVKIFRPRIRLVTFLHLAKHAHLIDRMVTTIAVRLSHEVWGDSQQTLTSRLDGISYTKSQVISFVTKRIAPFKSKSIQPVFIYWGRIHAQKKIQRALRFFSSIRAKYPTARYIIIGPDGGSLNEIKNTCKSLSLDESVNFIGSCSFDEISGYAGEASFYLQTSEVEGMAMSVVEAMQLGLVPIVTPVGEIGKYARNGENAVVVTDDDSAVADVLDLLKDKQRYQNMRQQAINTWKNKPLYKDSVLAACQDVLDMEKSH